MEITPNAKRILTACILLSLTLFFRLYRLGDIPFGINNDAIWESSAARAIALGNWKDYIPYAAAWHGEPMIRILILGLIPSFGDMTWTVKLASAVFGILLIPFLYRLISMLFSRRIGLLTTLFVISSGWHIIMSRSGWRAITVPTITTFMFLALLLAYRTSKRMWYMLAGISVGLTMYTYDASRIYPVAICFCIFLAILISPSFRLRHGRGVIIGFISFLITIIPITTYAATHWNDFAGRSRYLFVGAKVMQQKSFRPLINNAQATAMLFTHRGNGNDFFITEPLLDPPSVWLFPIGFFLTLWYAWRRKNHHMALMLGWFFLGLLPAFVSEPNGNRAIGTIPSVYFFVALATSQLASMIGRLVRIYRPFVEAVIIIYILCLSIIATHISYFGPQRRQPKGFYPETYVAARYLQTIQSPSSIYVTDNFPREILTYMLYQNGDPFAPNYTWFPQKEYMLNVHPKPKEMTVFVLAANESNLIFSDRLLARFPFSRRFPLVHTTDALRIESAIIVEVTPP